jgi:alkaline phosphatase D
MIGHVSDSSAQIWLRAKVGAAVEARAVQGESVFAPASTEDLSHGFLRLHFDGLSPETDTLVELTARRDGDQEEREQVTFRTAPAPGETGRVSLAFGSCSKFSQYGVAPIFQAIADEKPDFFLFGGDNIYFIVGDGGERHFSTTGPVGDWNSYEAMMARHLRARTHPDVQRLLRTIPSYAVWDDHDFGPNNADSTFPMKDEATRAFQTVWANPAFGTPETPGIFSSFRHGPVEVFLMDNRTYKYSHQRHNDTTREDGRIWGEAQLDWLLAGLKASSAPVKLIVNGTQFLGLDDRGEGHYQEALGERERLLQFLAEERIGGVVFLTGDRHHSEAMQQEQPDGTLLLEFTSSPLQQGQALAPLRRSHPNQVWGMRGNSFGLVTVDIPANGEATIRFEARDEQNQVAEIDGEQRATTWALSRLNY